MALSRPNAVDRPDRVMVGPDDVQSVRLYVTAPADIVRSPVLANGEKAINIAIRDMESGAVASRNTVFRGPQSRSQGRR